MHILVFGVGGFSEWVFGGFVMDNEHVSEGRLLPLSCVGFLDAFVYKCEGDPIMSDAWRGLM